MANFLGGPLRFNRPIAGLYSLIMIMGANALHSSPPASKGTYHLWTTKGSSAPITIMFPLDILEYIVDFLHGDTDALRMCSLTCQSLLPTTRLHLFRRIVLKGYPDSLRFLEVLETSALTQCSVANYVRDIRLPLIAFVTGGRKNYEVVRRVLRNLRHLSRLWLYNFDWAGFMEILRTNAGPRSLRDAMAAFFPFQELKELIIDHLASRSSYELVLFISVFPQLSRLELRRLFPLFISETGMLLPEPAHDGREVLPNTEEMGARLRTLVANCDRCAYLIIERVLGRLLSPPFCVQLSHIEWEMCQEEFKGGDINDSISLLDVLQSSESALESLKVSIWEDGRLS